MQKALLKSSLLRLNESAPSVQYITKAFAYLESHSHVLELPADEFLLRIGEAPDRYFFVQSGSVLAKNNDGKVLHDFQAGQGFGEQWLLFENEPSAVDCITGANGAVLLTVARDVFQSQFAEIFSLQGPFRGRVIRAKQNRNSLHLARDVCEFRGIRFASLPTRFGLPQVCDYVNDNSVVDAFEFGPECAQIKDGLADLLGAGVKPRSVPSRLVFVDNNRKAAKPDDEQCLCLNVYAPKTVQGKLPVMVWIHGGAFVTGAGSLPVYNGRPLASKGVIVVTINYRLGALGFLTGVPGLELNLGLHDQVAALRWVQRHISHFGGDHTNVTVFGESAGGMSATCLLGMQVRREEQLFQRCIVQSGGGHAVMNESQARFIATLFSQAIAKKRNNQAAGELTLDWLNTCPMQMIVDCTSEVLKQAAVRKELFGYGIPFQPVVLQNGPAKRDILFGSVPPLVAIARGVADDVSLMVGVNNNEYTLFMMDGAWRRRLNKLKHSRQAFSAYLQARLVDFASAEDTRHRPVQNLEARAAEVVNFYLDPKAAGGLELTEPEARLAFERIHSCWLFEIGSDQLVTFKRADGGGKPTHAYRVCFKSPMEDLQSAHAIELPLVFGTYATDPMGIMLCGGDSPETRACSLDMMDTWIAFAKGKEEKAGVFLRDGKPKLFGNLDMSTDPTKLLAGSIYKTAEERKVWQGFMEKVELNYPELLQSKI